MPAAHPLDEQIKAVRDAARRCERENSDEADSDLAAAVDGLAQAAGALAESRRLERMGDWYIEATVPEVIAGNIRSLREESGWSQVQFAAYMGMLGYGWKRLTATEVEGGTRRVSWEELIAIAAAFGVPVASLLVPPVDHVIVLPGASRLTPAAFTELLVGNGGSIGTGGTDWAPGAAFIVTMGGGNEVRPAVDLWRRRARPYPRRWARPSRQDKEQ